MSLFEMVMSALVAAVVMGTVMGWRWGVSFGARACPQCHTKLPAFRKPTSLGQTLWGGWTCHTCGCEVDKWGRTIARRPAAAE